MSDKIVEFKIPNEWVVPNSDESSPKPVTINSPWGILHCSGGDEWIGEDGYTYYGGRVGDSYVIKTSTAAWGII